MRTIKLKLVDVEITKYEAIFGTCEFCMSVGTAQEPTYEFEKEDGTSVFVDGYSWCWGDLDTIEVDNIITFAEFVAKQDFPEDVEMDYGWLQSLVYECDDYIYELKGE